MKNAACIEYFAISPTIVGAYQLAHFISYEAESRSFLRLQPPTFLHDLDDLERTVRRRVQPLTLVQKITEILSSVKVLINA